jgi:hypothetical protein
LIGWLKKKEKRRRKKEETHGAEGLRWVLSEGQPATSQQVNPPHSKSTTGHRDPRLGLAGHGFGFFFFPFQWFDFFFFFGFLRMIKFQKG